MAKKYRIVTIDFNEWCTQQEKSDSTSEKLSTISRRVKRTKESETRNPIDILEIPELGITLVKR